MERIEEFTLNEKKFMYIDLSNIKSNDDFLKLTAIIEPLIAKYPKNTLYTITNIENTRFDSESKEIITKYLENNKPYVKYGAVIGLDGIKKVMVNITFKMSERRNMRFAFSRNSAIEWLLQQE